jgi:hypothetical protein
MLGRLVSELSRLGRGRRYLLSCLYCAAGEMREVQVEMAVETATEGRGISINYQRTEVVQYSNKQVKGLTLCCIDGHGISSLVSFLVLGYHHLDIQPFQSLFWH